MGSRAIKTRDVPWIVKILYEDPEIVENRDRLCMALGLSSSHLTDIKRAVAIYVSNTHGFLNMALNLWISISPSDATMGKLIDVLFEEDFNRTADRINQKLLEQLDISSAERFLDYAEASVHFEIPNQQQNSIFVGRTQELEQIHNSLMQQSFSNGAHDVTVITNLNGQYGVGKSTLAIQYVREYSKQENEFYFNVIWINSESPEAISNSFRRLVRKLGKTVCTQQSELVSEIFEYFEKSMTLVVFHNAKSFDDIRSFLPNRKSNVIKPFVLVTSRNQQWEHTKIDLIYLSPFSIQDAHEFLQKSLELKSLEEIEIVKIICSNLQNLPLALFLAAAHIKYEITDRSLTLSALKLYQGYLEAKSNPLQNIRNIYMSTISLTVDITIQNLKERNPIFEHLLNTLAYFDPNYCIPVRLLYDLRIPSLLLFSSSPKPSKIDEALRTLADYQILEYFPEKSLIKLQRLIQNIIRSQIDSSQEILVIKSLVKLIQKPLKLTSFDEYEQNYLVHAASITTLARSRKLDNSNPSLYELLKLKIENTSKAQLRVLQKLINEHKYSNVIQCYEETRVLLNTSVLDEWKKGYDQTELFVTRFTILLSAALKVLWEGSSTTSFYNHVLQLSQLCKEVIVDLGVRVSSPTSHELMPAFDLQELGKAADSIYFITNHLHSGIIKRDLIELALSMYTVLYGYAKLAGNYELVTRYWRNMLTAQGVLQQLSNLEV